MAVPAAVAAVSSLSLSRDIAHVLHHVATEVADSEFDEDLVRLLLEQPHLDLGQFPFMLLSYSGWADEQMSDNTDWVAGLWRALPIAKWEWDTEGFVEKLRMGVGGRLGLLELLLWATLVGRDRLARLLWQHSEEPIRYALLVSQLYDHIASQEKTQSSHADKMGLRAQYEEWAVQLLAACREEVAIELLEDDFEGRWPTRLLELAICGGSKRFVAHEYCEELIDRRWRGDTLDSDAVMPRSCSYSFALRCVAHDLLRELEHALSPAEPHSPPRHPTERRRAATGARAHSARAHAHEPIRSGSTSHLLSVRAPRSGTLHVPFVKFVLRTLLELLLLLLYAAVLLSSPLSAAAPSPLEAILYGWGWTLILDEYYQYRSASSSLSDHFDSVWNWVDLLKLSSLLLASTAHCLVALPLAVSGLGRHAALALSYARTILALGALPAFTRVFAAISLDQKYGVLFLSFVGMFAPIKRFMVLLGMVMLAFSLTFTGLLSAEPRAVDAADAAAAAALDAASAAAAPDSTTTRSFLLAFWALHGEMFGREVVEMPALVALLLWVYFMLSQVVLLNLLVAIMGDTWQQIRENADNEWKYLKINAIEEFFELHHVPPPFNAGQLVRLLRGHVDGTGRRSMLRCTRRRGAVDVKKVSKAAQLALLKQLRQQEDLASESQLRELKRAQHEVVRKLDLLASQIGMADATAGLDEDDPGGD